MRDNRVSISWRNEVGESVAASRAPFSARGRRLKVATPLWARAPTALAPLQRSPFKRRGTPTPEAGAKGAPLAVMAGFFPAIHVDVQGTGACK
jgi:hypothetical protein